MTTDCWCFQRAARKAFHRSATRFMSSDFIGVIIETETNRLHRLVSSGHIYFEILTSDKCLYNINHAHKEKTQDCK